MSRKKNIRYVLLALLLIIGAVAIYVYKEYNRMHKDIAGIKPDYTIKATDLIREFESDEQASNKKYWDKILNVEGMVKDLTRDDKGFYSIILGDTASMSSVRCSVDSNHAGEAAVLQKGSLINVKGVCTGFNTDELLGSDVILVRSVVDKMK